MSCIARVIIPRHLSMSNLGKKLITKSINGSIYKPQSRHLFTSLKTIFAETPIEDKSHLSPESIHGEKLLYEGNSAFTCRAMSAVGITNLTYWTYYLVNSYVYKDVVIQGIDLGGDPRWSIAGFMGTTLIFYCTREYSNHAALYAYESADGQRLGFQMYTMIGHPGRKIEANIGNVRLANTVAFNLGSDSFVPLRIEGVSKNVLLDKDGTYYSNNRLKELLIQGGTGVPGSKPSLAKKVEMRVTEQYRNKKFQKNKKFQRDL